MRRIWVGVGVAVLLGLLWLALVVAPPWFVQHRPLEVAKAQNDVRTTLLQVFGGAALVVGAYFTYRQLANSREQLAHTREQLQIAQQGQVTERFTRAIDQLGHKSADVRLGGIYGLERIANDSPQDRATIAEVLTAFVRGHAPRPKDPGPLLKALPDRAPDVQATMTVLGRRRPPVGPARPLLLLATDLRGAYLRRAQLNEAALNGALLQGASLIYAQLQEAFLRGAQLEGAYLTRAQLQKADLRDANLQGADLRRAQLQEADLRGAQLQRADLRNAELQGARCDARTVWPDGFDWRAAGVILMGEDTAASSHSRRKRGGLGREIAMIYRRSGSLWSLVRSIFTARAANRRRQPASRQGAQTRARRTLRRWLRS